MPPDVRPNPALLAAIIASTSRRAEHRCKAREHASSPVVQAYLCCLGVQMLRESDQATAEAIQYSEDTDASSFTEESQDCCKLVITS